MVYQVGGKAFEVKAHTDLTGIVIDAASTRAQVDRWQLNVAFRKDFQPGLMNGSILIKTNDPEFKTVTVPVRGGLLTEKISRLERSSTIRLGAHFVPRFRDLGAKAAGGCSHLSFPLPIEWLRRSSPGTPACPSCPGHAPKLCNKRGLSRTFWPM
jgi:hypothetical protein